MSTVLVVDDEPVVRDVVVRYLEHEGFETLIAADGDSARALIEEREPTLVVLDVMLPGIDGLEVCRRLRASPDWAALPIVMLTARGEDVDKIVGLELGADDYLAKPFNPRELLARVRAVLRRGRAPAAGARFRAGELEIDFDAREVTVDGRRVVLTHHEFELLAALARAAGRVLSREQLMDALTGQDYEAFDRSIDVHVSRLRQKLGDDPRKPRLIKTIRGSGYVLAGEGE